MIVLRKGRWQEALWGVRNIDALITDTPYSARTHSGHNSSSSDTNRVRGSYEQRLRFDKRNGSQYAVGKHRRQSIAYASWTESDVAGFVAHWAPRTRGWFVAMTDHVLAPSWMTSLERHGRYVFSPLSFVATGSRVRMTGDGPAQWSVWIVVARPRTPEFVRWGALPGAYVLPPGEARKSAMIGGKPLWLMRELIRDYSRPGDLICDPCAGAGTTLLAARAEGRRAIASESDPATYAIAIDALARAAQEEGQHG